MTEYVRPATWTPRAEEHPDVTALRAMVAEEERAWLQLWVNDATVPDMDLVAAFAHISYDNARRIVKAALEVECHCSANIPGYTCLYCQSRAAKELTSELQQG